MRNILILILVLLSLTLQANSVERIIMNDQWRFLQRDSEQAFQSDFDDSAWRTLDLPHDWSIEGKYHQTANGTDWQSGYLPAGIGWYRKTFLYDPSWAEKKVQVMFDGVFMNSTIWINGHKLGSHPNGYIGFYHDLTPYLQKGKNTIAVKVDTQKPLTGRWYSGSGIYRNVCLMVSNPTHIEPWGIFFTTPEVSDKKSTVNIDLSFSAGDIAFDRIEAELTYRDATVVRMKTSVSDSRSGKATLTGEIITPRLWSPESPATYTLTCKLMSGNKCIDSESIIVGVRRAEFTLDRGFLLNGVPTKFKGVCDHHTAGAVGAAIPDDVLLRRLRILKDMGCNAIRTVHNPFSPQFYTICDTLGLMVLNEAFDGWDQPKADDDYGNYFAERWQDDLTRFMLRDRNHPSVVMWSIGNEVPNNTPQMQKQLVDWCHKLDSTRPVTQGGTDPTRGMNVDYEKSFKHLDIIGFNGNGEEVGEFEKFQSENLKLCAVGTEVPHTYQTRGVYRTKTQWRRRDFPAPWELKNNIPWEKFKHRVFDIEDLSQEEFFPEESNMLYQSSYDNASVRISARASWQRTNSFPFLMGEFRWGAFDYLGEAEWPQRCGNFGIIDICGFPKDHYYLYQSLWSDKPMVHILPHWTHTGKEGKICPVVVYTNCKSVELFLNNESLGRKNYVGEQLVWQVPYASGEIKAVAYNKSGKVAEKIVATAGKAATTRVLPDKTIVSANNKDVIHLEVEVIDRKGTLVPLADNLLNVKVSGAATLLGMDNGDPIDLTPYRSSSRKAFRGKMLIMLKSTHKSGNIAVEVSSPGIKKTTLFLDSLFK